MHKQVNKQQTQQQNKQIQNDKITIKYTHNNLNQNAHIITIQNNKSININNTTINK